MPEPILLGDFNASGPFPRQSRRLRLGLVGGGGIAKVHNWAAHLSQRWRLVAAAPSSNIDKVRQASADAVLEGCRIYADYQEMARGGRDGEDQLDAVALTVPNDRHFEIARTFLDAGINVMCEKPLTITLEHAADLVERARTSGLVFAVAYPYAAFPMVRQARFLVGSGALGAIRQAYVEFVQDFLLTQATGSGLPGAWRLDSTRAGAGSSADVGTHAFQLFEFVTGLHIQRIRGELHVCGPVKSKSTEDTFYAFVRAEGGVPGILWGSQVAAGITGGPNFRIIGEKGTLEWNNESPQALKCLWLDQPMQVITRGQGRGVSPEAERCTRRGRGNTEGWVEAWANLYTEFALAVAARLDQVFVPPGVLAYPTVADGARGVRFIQSMAASDQAGGAWTEI